MIDTAVLGDVARQMMSGTKVEAAGKSLAVRRTGGQRLRTVAFEVDGREYDAVEQNPEKPSRWGQLAREGHQVVQFIDRKTRAFVAVSIDGVVKEYGAMRRGKKRPQT